MGRKNIKKDSTAVRARTRGQLVTESRCLHTHGVRLGLSLFRLADCPFVWLYARSRTKAPSLISLLFGGRCTRRIRENLLPFVFCTSKRAKRGPNKTRGSCSVIAIDAVSRQSSHMPIIIMSGAQPDGIVTGSLRSLICMPDTDVVFVAVVVTCFC